MFCDACGAPLDESQAFCRICGKPVGARSAAPVAPPAGRVGAHVRTLAVLWIVAGVIHVMPAVALFTMSRMQFPSDIPDEVRGFVYPLLHALAWALALLAAASFIAAWGLLERLPWARLYTIILGALSLINVPFGTALGIYSLWVLLPQTSENEYRQLSS